MSTFPWTSILICLAVTVGGGLGLLRSVCSVEFSNNDIVWKNATDMTYDNPVCRFYEEGDAARLVIPPHSEFRRNIDWIDENFPREVRYCLYTVKS